MCVALSMYAQVVWVHFTDMLLSHKPGNISSHTQTGHFILSPQAVKVSDIYIILTSYTESHRKL